MIGFDYGTSNCAVAIMDNNSPKLLTLGEHGGLMPSTLYSASRETIVNWLGQNIPADQQRHFNQERQLQLSKGSSILRELAFDGISSELAFGRQALTRYLEDPEEGYYLKSPKSFLGASGLHPQQIALFEDIVAAMMCHVKRNAEDSKGAEITQAVIGRPINFQGLKGEKSNQQAIEILTRAAKRVGFKDVEFQFEPVAAGFEFEATLSQEKRVLVVDIGGGTTDISMLLMGPKLAPSLDRSAHLLGHSGQRIGGNDLDIQLTMRGIMPSLGVDSVALTGKPMPTSFHWQAASINNANDQSEFYSAANQRALKDLIKTAASPALVTRLLKVQQEKLSYQLVNSGERAKIALSDSQQHPIDLGYLDDGLIADVTRDTLLQANRRHLQSIAKLIDATIADAGCQPDVIFVTGGSAKSPVLHNFLQQHFAHSELVTGDHFASVTAGLARWSQRLFS